MEPLKEMFNMGYYKNLASALKQVDKSFKADLFIKDATHAFETLSLNERMRNTSVQLKKHLPYDYKKSIEILKQVATIMPTGYTALVFPDFVSQYGLNTFKASMDALAYFTSFGSSEFAIRVFLRKDFKSTLPILNKWATHNDTHIRRLASEGSRPRLPWGGNLIEVIQQPQLTTPILDQLKSDTELYVKKSVANHLNDISKDNTAYMLSLIKKWDFKNINTAWIIKHACRSLIKKGNKDCLALFNFEQNTQIQFSTFALDKKTIQLNDTLSFSFKIQSLKNTVQKVVIDYCVYYQKKSGELNRKVFKLKEVNLLPQETLSIGKKQTFKNFTTRIHYKGLHQIAILINGKEYPKLNFMLQ